jgi:hypothetical protein
MAEVYHIINEYFCAVCKRTIGEIIHTTTKDPNKAGHFKHPDICKNCNYNEK